MQAAVTRGRSKSPTGGTGRDVSGDAVASEVDSLLGAARQTYLDALPIAAAIVTANADEPLLEAANELFRSIAEWDERLGERRLSQIRLLRTGTLASRLATFLKSHD